MRNKYPNVPVITHRLFLLCLLLLGSGGVVANPVYPDEESISNGAQLYDLYCSDCHGSDPANDYDQMYAPDPADAEDDYSKLIDLVRNEESAQLIAVPEEEEEWPEWADRPNPNAEAVPDPKAQTLAELTAVIDAAHGIAPVSTGAQETDDFAEPDADTGDADSFEPVPGATNLADPTTYFYGTSEQEVFDSIANGTGAGMAGWRDELGNENAIWDLVNYIRSLWGEEWQN
ncbi:MAG: c-type cytochrome [Halioglobus sp.]